MIKSYKPTSAGIRSRKTLVREVDKVTPEKGLTKAFKGTVGRNHGTISSRHRIRGTRKFYRIIDYKRDKKDIPGVVASIQYDPNRGPNIALINYKDGEKRYILAPEGLSKGAIVVSGENVEPAVGNSLPLSKIPLGAFVHNIEINPGRGGQIVRGAGNGAQILAKEGNYVNIKLPSGEVKRFRGECYATVGILGNSDLRNTRLGKAGKQKYLGRRPHIRGVAVANPTDHPHGGSYKDNGIGMPSPKSPWGWKTRGVRTRRRTRTNRTIVSSRKGKK